MPEFVGQVEDCVCVLFHAPPWARSVAGLWVHPSQDTIPNDPPYAWTTEEFHAYVWQVAPGELRPSLPACSGIPSGSGYPEDELSEFRFPEPVSIEDGAAFPDKQFFLGLEWVHEDNPVVLPAGWGLPVFKTWEYRSGQWSLSDRNVMVRAIVTDEPGTPVESQTWAGIKAMFR
jgi:hypothetical protein